MPYGKLSSDFERMVLRMDDADLVQAAKFINEEFGRRGLWDETVSAKGKNEAYAGNPDSRAAD